MSIKYLHSQNMNKFLVFLSILSACEYYPQDCKIEESIEEVIQKEFDYDLDLSPISPEPHV